MCPQATAKDPAFFDGSERDAFVLAVKANVSRGLPLSLDDRSAARVNNEFIADNPDSPASALRLGVTWLRKSYAAAVSLRNGCQASRIAGEDVSEETSRV
jgi:hypothetical protein